MKKYFLISITCLFVFACSSANKDTITQISTIDALLAGFYDGVLPLEKLNDYGNFGIGTFNKLEGEMIVLDGKIYQFKADGKIYIADPKNTTPFASVVNFNKDISFQMKSKMNYVDFQQQLDSLFKNKNYFYAVKVTGNFSYVKTRSVPAQQKPYKPLSEVTKTQPVFEKQEQSGTLVGFRLPPFTSGLNVPGYHMHFISSNFLFGGHVLDFTIENAEVEIQVLKNFYMLLPDDKSAFGNLNLDKDRSDELHRAEK